MNMLHIYVTCISNITPEFNIFRYNNITNKINNEIPSYNQYFVAT